MSTKQEKCDPFWEENSKLSVEEIDKNFPAKTAAALKAMKAQNEKSE